MSRWAVGILLIALAAWVGTVATFYFGYDRLPERVPIHFNVEGVADRWTTRDQLLPFWLIVPLFCLLVIGIGIGIPRLAPSLVAREGVRDKYEFILFLAALLMAAVQAMVVASSFGVQFDFGRVILTVVFAFFGAIGYAMRGLKRNPVMGIRLPWTLKSDAVWDETHRAASRMYIAVGGIGAGCALAGLFTTPAGLVVAIVSLFVFVAIAPIVYSAVVASRHPAG